MDSVQALRSNTEHLWQTAVQSLSDEDKANLDLSSQNALQVLEQSLKLTDDAEKRSQKDAWQFTRRSGEKVIVRDVFSKVALWINHFKAVGDTVVQYDPAHAALPWASLRFILQVCMDHFETHEFLLEKIPKIAEQICRCALIETLLGASSSGMAEELRQALLKLYTRILTYLARAKTYIQKTTKKQLLHSLKGKASELASLFQTVIDAQKHVKRCFQMASAQEQLEKLDGIKEAFAKFEEPMNRWSADLASIMDTLDASKRRQLLDWISKEPYVQHHKHEREQFLPGTGEWLLTHPVFKRWKEESASSILWLHGIPGSGKSKLVSLVIENAREAFEARQSPPPAYFYCARNPAEPGRSDPKTILATIARQLSSITPRGPLLPPAIAEYEAYEDGCSVSGPLTLKEIANLLLKLVQYYPAVTIILDALDECDPGTRPQLLKSLERILQDSPTLVKIFVSSRDDQDIVCKLRNYPSLELSSDKNFEDIKRFVESETTESIQNQTLLQFSNNKEELTEKIVEKVTKGANGMFRWASLQLQMLCELTTDDAILERLGRLPAKLEKLYSEVLKKIRCNQATNDRQCAKRALAWLLSARRNMTSVEYLAAISTPSSRPVNKEQVLNLCCNLITFDSSSDTFRFAHLSVREFLEKQEEYSVTTTNALIAEDSLQCLMAHSGVQGTREIGLHPYASLFWAAHCQSANTERKDGQLKDRLSKFFSDHQAIRSPYAHWNAQLYNRISTFSDDEYVRNKLKDCQSQSPAVVASAFNMSEWIDYSSRFLKSKEKVIYCMTVAARHGSCEALKQLIQSNVPLSPRTVLAAARNDRNGEEVMKLLLNQRGDQVMVTEEVVKAAAGNCGNGKEIMTLLLDRRGDQVIVTEKVLKAAAGNYRNGKEIMTLLLDRRGDQVMVTEDMVSLVAKYFDKEVMTLLLGQRGDQQAANAPASAPQPAPAPVAPPQAHPGSNINFTGMHNFPCMCFNDMDFANPLTSDNVLQDFDFDSFLHEDGDPTAFDFNPANFTMDAGGEIIAD